jgi:hypothetical protein
MTFPGTARPQPGRAPSLASGASLIFSMLFGVIYSLCFYYNWPMFAYYPQVNEFHLSANLQNELGPPILWYGWLSTAALASAAGAVLVPRSLAARLPPNLAWAVPGAVVLAILIYEKRWFF